MEGPEERKTPPPERKPYQGETVDGFMAPAPAELERWRREYGEILELDYNDFMPGLVVVCRYPGVLELKAATGEKATYENTHNFVVKLTLWPKQPLFSELLKKRAGLVNAVAGELLSASGWSAKAAVKNG